MAARHPEWKLVHRQRFQCRLVHQAWNAALQEVRSEMAGTVKDIENAAKAAAERHASEIGLLNAALESERKQLESIRREAKGLQELLAEARAATADLQVKFKTTVAEHEETMRQQLQEFEKEKRHVEEQHKRGVEQLKEQAKEISLLKEQFNSLNC